MIIQLKTFKKNALALELLDSFTAADARLIEMLFDEKLNDGYDHINILIKVKDLSILKHIEWKGFFGGELWGIKHFKQLGRCAVVSHSGFIESIINTENKLLHLFNSSLDEKYFDETQLEEALKFISPDE